MDSFSLRPKPEIDKKNSRIVGDKSIEYSTVCKILHTDKQTDKQTDIQASSQQHRKTQAERERQRVVLAIL